MQYDNVVIHHYPSSPCIAKCAMNFRKGNKIVSRIVLKDAAAAALYMQSRQLYLPVKNIIHLGV